MSFFGKKYKKSSEENMRTVLASLDLDEGFLKMVQTMKPISWIDKNADGTYTNNLDLDGTVKTSVFELNKEKSDVRPDGKPIKTTYHLEGDVLSQDVELENGKKLQLKREYTSEGMTLYVKAEGADEVGMVYYTPV